MKKKYYKIGFDGLTADLIDTLEGLVDHIEPCEPDDTIEIKVIEMEEEEFENLPAKWGD